MTRLHHRRRHLLPLLVLVALSASLLAWLPGSRVVRADDAAPPDAPPPQPVVEETRLFDFDAAPPEEFVTDQCTVEHLTADDEPAAGAGALRLVLGTDGGFVRLPVPEGVNFAEHAALTASLRVRSGEELGLRWIAFDGRGNAIWQRREDLPAATADGQWHRHEFPLAGFRWGNRHVGNWSDVRELALVIIEREAPIRVDLDELALQRGSRGAVSAWHTEQWLRDIAFGERPAKFVRRGRILVGIDLPDAEAAGAVTDEELAALAAHLEPLTAWVRRLFGDAVRPVGGDLPVPMLIFRNETAYRSFFRRLGEDWNVTISPPGAGGYTVQDLATSSYDSEKGLGRPVYLHETMHAVVARDLRLIPGNPYHDWLQEGLANYLQLATTPESLPREVMAGHFQRAPRRDGRGFFKPISYLLTRRVGLNNYAQLASLVAFFEAVHPDWLPTLARLVADGERIDRVLAAVGTDFDKLEAEWFAWGQKLYAAEPPAGPGSHFARPKEWATAAEGTGSE